jgi:uncharacterized membrane protein
MAAAPACTACETRAGARAFAAGAALLWLIAGAPPARAEAGDPVRAVLFVSPRCPHCRTVQEEVLPVFAARFGDRVQLALVNAATPSGQELFRTASRYLGVRRPGVPMLVVADRVLLGSLQIPEEFPELAESLLAAGGSPWPDIPGLERFLADAERERTREPAAAAAAPPPAPAPAKPATVSTAAAAAQVARAEPVAATARTDAVTQLRPQRPQPVPAPPRATPTPIAALASPSPGPLLVLEESPPGFLTRFAMDPYGNSLALLVLVAMVGVATRSAVLLRRTRAVRWTLPSSWATPALALAGMGVASYLAWVEIGENEAICGPLGDCNTVQQSDYASLFGIVPIGVLGVAGFAATLLAWWLGRNATGPASERIGLAFFALTGCGTLFSIYLTFLEPFVIGATCLWCLGSAVIMTLLHRSSIGRGRAAAPLVPPEGALRGSLP